MTDEYEIEAIVRGDLSDGYRLKVSVLSLGMYIDGFRAHKSSDDESGWWIQEPAYRVGYRSQYKHSPEFNKKHPFWKTIEHACARAADQAEYDKQDVNAIDTPL